MCVVLRHGVASGAAAIGWPAAQTGSRLRKTNTSPLRLLAEFTLEHDFARAVGVGQRSGLETSKSEYLRLWTKPAAGSKMMNSVRHVSGAT
jgi:hypothetical protein